MNVQVFFVNNEKSYRYYNITEIRREGGLISLLRGEESIGVLIEQNVTQIIPIGL